MDGSPGGTLAPDAASPAGAGLCKAGRINLAAQGGAASLAGLALGRAEPVGFADLARGVVCALGTRAASTASQPPEQQGTGDAARVSFAAVPSPMDHLLILGLFVLKTFLAAGGRESLPLGCVAPRGQPGPLPALGLWGLLHGVGRDFCSNTMPAAAKSHGLSQPHRHQPRVVTIPAQIPPGSSLHPQQTRGVSQGYWGATPALQQSQDPGCWDGEDPPGPNPTVCYEEMHFCSARCRRALGEQPGGCSTELPRIRAGFGPRSGGSSQAAGAAQRCESQRRLRMLRGAAGRNCCCRSVN